MIQRLPTFAEFPKHIMTLTLSGKVLRYQRTYRPRTGSWYVDIFDRDEKPLLLGRRLVGQQVVAGPEVLSVDGLIYARGPDEPRREDLGEALREYYVELDALTPEVDDVADAFIVSVESNEEVP